MVTFNTVSKGAEPTWATLGGTWNSNAIPWDNPSGIITFNTVAK